MNPAKVSLAAALYAGLLLTCGCQSTNFLARTNQDMPKESGFFSEEMIYQGEQRKFVVFVPQGYRSDRPHPVILFLHGLGGAGNDGLQQVATGFGRYIAENWRTFGFIVVFPQTRWDWSGTEDQDEALAALEETQSRYNVDPDRIMLTGISLGGYGAWMLAARHPNHFAAVVTMSGLSEERVANKLTTMPVWCFHYTTDPLVSCGNSERMVQRINAAGGMARLTKVPGFGHDVWQKAYEDGVLDWLIRQRREAGLGVGPVRGGQEEWSSGLAKTGF